MTLILVDIESDGPIPGDYSMTEFGAVVFEEGFTKTFHGKLKPISKNFIPEVLAISGRTREECLKFDEPKEVLEKFEVWLKEVSKGQRVRFMSDNNGFDFMFMAWYFHHFLGRNPFGHSSENLGSLYKGLMRSGFENFKHLRKTTHTHHPVQDALGNAEALLEIKKKFKLKGY